MMGKAIVRNLKAALAAEWREIDKIDDAMRRGPEGIIRTALLAYRGSKVSEISDIALELATEAACLTGGPSQGISEARVALGRRMVIDVEAEDGSRLTLNARTLAWKAK